MNVFHRTARISPRRTQLGESTVAYTSMCVALVAALLIPLPGSQETVSQLLCDAIRNFYSSLSLFISLP